MEDLTHACVCVVIFWWFVHVSIKLECDWDCFVFWASYSTPLSLMERMNYSISLCEHGEVICHQRSVGCS